MILKAGVHRLFAVILFVLGVFCIAVTYKSLIRDFGNYYFGSQLVLNGLFNANVYQSIHYFNSQASALGASHFFGNYLPVPPFSTVFYLPLCFLNPVNAKLIFNLLGLLVFCLSCHRLLMLYKHELHWGVVFLPLVFFCPILNNIAQGQAYLFVGSLMIETFILAQKGRVLLPGLFIALSVSLKLFPAFILVYFLFTRNFRILIASVFLMIALQLLTLLVIGMEPIAHYYSYIFPRLINNDVVGPYYPGNQSVYTALLSLFSYDGLYNTSPLIDAGILVSIIESIITAVTLFACIYSLKKHPFFSYSIFLFACVILSRYSPSYSLVFLIPAGISAFLYYNKTTALVIVAVMVIAVNFPMVKFIDSFFVLKYLRVLLLLTVFFIMVGANGFNLKLSLAFALTLTTLVVIKIIFLPIKPCNYFYVQNSKGILYKIQSKGDTLVLKSTLGWEVFTEQAPVNGKLLFTPRLYATNRAIIFNNKVLYSSSDNKSSPFIYNDTAVVFMSDLNQGVGFYKLRWIPLRDTLNNQLF